MIAALSATVAAVAASALLPADQAMQAEYRAAFAPLASRSACCELLGTEIIRITNRPTTSPAESRDKTLRLYWLAVEFHNRSEDIAMLDRVRRLGGVS